MIDDTSQDMVAEIAEERNELAHERTDWSVQRTLLANERTFSAWVRTGLASTAGGLGIARFIQSANTPWLAGAMGGMLILVGAGAYLIGFWRYVKGYNELESDGLRITPPKAAGVMVLLLIASSILALVLLFKL
jgi:putative membrane protein